MFEIAILSVISGLVSGCDSDAPPQKQLKKDLAEDGQRVIRLEEVFDETGEDNVDEDEEEFDETGEDNVDEDEEEEEENKPPEPTVILDCSLKCLEKKKICPATEENGKKMVNACCISGDTLPDYVNPYITKWCNNREVKS